MKVTQARAFIGGCVVVLDAQIENVIDTVAYRLDQVTQGGKAIISPPHRVRKPLEEVHLAPRRLVPLVAPDTLRLILRGELTVDEAMEIDRQAFSSRWSALDELIIKDLYRQAVEGSVSLIKGGDYDED